MEGQFALLSLQQDLLQKVFDFCCLAGNGIVLEAQGRG